MSEADGDRMENRAKALWNAIRTARELDLSEVLIIAEELRKVRAEAIAEADSKPKTLDPWADRLP